MADLILECEDCHGKRFKQDLLEVRYEGVNVYDILNMTVNQAIEFFEAHQQKRIVALLKPLQDVGLGYIKLGQSSSTLSGGENQRVKLAYYLSMEKQKPTVFIFDEPTTGLHFNDIKKLLASFNALIERGHTLIIIEHNTDVIKCADYLIDLGPEGGRKLMESEYMEDVKCDYLQMSHHGQDGCDKDFYMKAQFRACFWPTPSWVYNNDFGDGFNTGGLKTIEVRDWMKEKGITEHYVSCEGLVCIR